MALFDELLAFSNGRPIWQRDLLRRLVIKNELLDSDLKDAIDLARSDRGVPSNTGSSAPIPLSRSDLPEQVVHNAKPCVLTAVQSVRNAMNLQEGQRLTFAPDGLTVIYGGNGSGKSGYARILKRVCRSPREAREDSLKNAFAQADSSLPTAEIVYQIGDTPLVTFPWEEGVAAPAELSRITVFDTRVAPISIDSEGRLDVLPRPIAVLEKATGSIKEVGNQLRSERNQLIGSLPPLPDVPTGTAASALLQHLKPGVALKHIPSIDDVERIAKWSEIDDGKLAFTIGQLTNSPRTLAEGCSVLADAAKRLAESISVALPLLSDDAVTALAKAGENARDARNVASLAASDAFREEPLGEVGSEPWRRMFAYALEYNELTGADNAFPIGTERSICPLCQQVLGGGAVDRLRRFYEFVCGRANEDAEKLEEAYSCLLRQIESLDFGEGSEAQSVLDANEFEKRSGLFEVKKYFAILKERRDSIRSNERIVPGELLDESHVLSADDALTSQLMGFAEQMSEEARQHLARDTNSEQSSELMEMRDELLGRKALADHKETILKCRPILENIARLKDIVEECETGPFSIRITQMRKNHVDEEFLSSLVEELEKLDVSHIKPEIQTRSETGRSYLRIGLDGAQHERVSSILSEGEFRALAIASFFAQIRGIPGHQGLIFDDPVSSFDHLYLRRAAERLAAEARARQVIVFTHNLSLYVELQSIAGEIGVPIRAHWIRRTSLGAGEVKDGQGPWDATSTKTRIKELRKRVNDLQIGWDDNADDCRSFLIMLEKDVRDTWEKLVEDVLLNKVTLRFRKGVETQRLSGVEVTTADYSTVVAGMASASEGDPAP